MPVKAGFGRWPLFMGSSHRAAAYPADTNISCDNQGNVLGTSEVGESIGIRSADSGQRGQEGFGSGLPLQNLVYICKIRKSTPPGLFL